MASETRRPNAPVDWHDAAEHRRKLAELINHLLQMMEPGSVTLTANSATTTLSDRRIGANSYIDFMPTTDNAATAMANLNVSSRGKQTATLTHANTADTDKTFEYVVLG